jgi:tetratricopeptide (TPR) repeat protein
MSAVVSAALVAACLSGCVLRGPPPPPSGTGVPGETPSGTGQPTPVPGEPPSGLPGQPPVQGPRQFRLGAAASALVGQAHAQAGGGDFGQAAATLERALRIEPGNPLLWIELGRVRLGEGNAAQADAMGRKAAALATGDHGAQAAAWRLIADSLRARDRNPEAAEAEQRAGALSPR